MYSRISFIVRSLVVAIVGFSLLLMGLSQANAVKEGVTAEDKATQTELNNGEPNIQTPELISIPYGFDVTLPLTDGGDAIVASGKGACTANEEITIAFTVTQSSSGAMATGLWSGACTGELQDWTKVGTTATPSPNFTLGQAEGCAFAETRDAGDVTDTQQWCDAVYVASDTIFLPSVRKP